MLWYNCANIPFTDKGGFLSMFQVVRGVGAMVLGLQRRFGHMFLFLLQGVALSFSPPFKFKLFVRRIQFFGTKSLIIVLVTGAFTGMVLALQVFYSLRKVGSEALLGPLVALSLIRELGPVLSALMVTGRAGSALAAEIGIMRMSEQIDAITSMALNPLRYLLVPNLAAAVLCFPLLAALFDVIGIYGGYLVAVKMLGMSDGTYFSQMDHMVEWSDIRIGLYKSLSFGVIVSWICCYKGYYADKTGFGAEGVSRATTDAVVTSSVLILIWDYFLGSVLL